MTKPKDPNECGARVNLYFRDPDALEIAKRKAAIAAKRAGLKNPGRALSWYLNRLIERDDPYDKSLWEAYNPAGSKTRGE